MNHDVDDAIRAGVIEPGTCPRGRPRARRTHGERIDTLVTDLVPPATPAEASALDRVFAALDTLRDFMFERVYLRSTAADEQRKAVELVRALFGYYLEHPEALPADGATRPGSSRLTWPTTSPG